MLLNFKHMLFKTKNKKNNIEKFLLILLQKFYINFKFINKKSFLNL